MTNPEIIKKWRSEFCEWILKEYLFEVKFDGNLLAVASGNPEEWTPLVIAQAAWKSWIAARESVVIELPKLISGSGSAHVGHSLGVEQCMAHIIAQGYRVKGES